MVNNKFLKPTISVDYLVRGMSISGTFEEVPENVYGAIITSQFPTINCYGEIFPQLTEFRIIIGESVLLTDALIKVSDPKKRKRLEYLKNNGEKSIVAMGENGIYPGSLATRVVSSYEELKAAINKIYKAYQSLEITVSVKTNAPQTKNNIKI